MSDEEEKLKASFDHLRSAHAASQASKAVENNTAAAWAAERHQKHRASVVAINSTAGDVLEKFRKFIQTEFKQNAIIDRGQNGAIPVVSLRWGPMMTSGGGLPMPAHLFGVTVDPDWTTFRAKAQILGTAMAEIGATTELTSEWVTEQITKAIDSSFRR